MITFEVFLNPSGIDKAKPDAFIAQKNKINPKNELKPTEINVSLNIEPLKLKAKSGQMNNHNQISKPGLAHIQKLGISSSSL